MLVGLMSGAQVFHHRCGILSKPMRWSLYLSIAVAHGLARLHLLELLWLSNQHPSPPQTQLPWVAQIGFRD
jgi:hypothetical protein